VDELVNDVARAKDLITFCDKKIKSAGAQIQELVKDLQVQEPASTATAAAREKRQVAANHW
jgi:hypothetical protein